MPKLKRILILVFIFQIVGCASVPISENSEWVIPSDDKERIMIFRPAGSHTKFVKLFVGQDEKYALGLSERQYSWLYLAPGAHQIEVKVTGYRPEMNEISIEKEEAKCILLVAGAAGWAKMLLNPAIMADSNFYKLEKVDCPSTEKLNGFTEI